jgi:carboxypeptidase-like protein
MIVLAGCGGGGGSTAAPAVTQKVTGFVWDNDTAAPIQGATVKVQGTTISAVTAPDGSYTVGPLNPTRSYNLLVSNTGYVNDAVKMLSKNATLQGPEVILTKANPSATIQNTGGTVTSNATLDGNTGTVTIPANALPGGATTASVSATLITGAATPGAPTDPTQVAYPVLSVGITGATGNFAQPVMVTLPVPFPLAAGATEPVLMLGADGNWAPTQPPSTATASADGKSASFTTSVPGTYALSLTMNATASLSGPENIQPVAGPYTDPVVVPLTGTTVNWTATAADARDALDSTFTQAQRQLNINIPGDLDAVQLVIHPRGTSLIEVLKDNLNVTFTSSGFTIQQAGNTPGGTITGLAYYEIVPHQQGSGTGS